MWVSRIEPPRNVQAPGDNKNYLLGMHVPPMAAA